MKSVRGCLLLSWRGEASCRTVRLSVMRLTYGDRIAMEEYFINAALALSRWIPHRNCRAVETVS